MPFWVRLIRFTNDGVKQLRTDQKAFLSDTHEKIHANGGKMVAAFATQGVYDVVSIIESPDQSQMDAIDQALKDQRFYTAKTLPAIPLDTFVDAMSADPNFGIFLESWYSKRPGGMGR